MTLFKNILVQVDSQDASPRALDQAIRLAKSNGARLKIVDVVPDFGWPAKLVVGGYERVVEQLTHAKEDHLKKLTVVAETEGIDVSSKLLEGPSSVSIIREVLRDGHDLVIRASRGLRSRASTFFGTTSTRLFRKCPCPVLLLRAGSVCECRRVVAAVDATPADDAHAALNETILQFAKSMCGDHDCVVDVVHGWDIYGESILKEHMRPEEFEELQGKTEAETKRLVDELVTPFGMRVGQDNVHVIHGDPASVIPQFVERTTADLVVLGTIARTGVSGLLIGNTAEQILNRIECSVLAVKPPGFVSPIHL
ncbi:MAG: universal stress protein [Planctomycetaceae bacterium]|nr:universal stress protein [Planctomycetales bacterium]MCB9921575.1 universal stress protein [Planctomycetaceae bacterium]